jgi:PBP1b-binding outer membrane lipoprotein LpoB
MRTGIAILGLALVLSGCGDDQAIETEASPVPTEELTSDELAYTRECGDTMSAAAQAAQDQGEVDAVDPAIAACATVDEFAAAVADHPGDARDAGSGGLPPGAVRAGG